MSERPGPLGGMRHIALRVSDMARARAFYEGVLGLRVVWEPDPENLYLSSGSDNVALHAAARLERSEAQALDHFGFVLPNRESVDAWAEYLRSRGVGLLRPVLDHRDGSRSFYLRDPDGNVIQMLYEPNIGGPVSDGR